MRRAILVSSTAILLATAAPVWAQSATLPAPPASDAGQGADTASDASREGNDIVVTARRSDERLQDIPLAISAIASESLSTRGSTGLGDVAAYTPGLQFRDFVSGFNGNVTIRGLAQANVQSAVPNVGVFVDGVYLQRGYMANFALSDIDRIEVVKGPQSALYGQNTFSGAINVVSKKPSEKWHADGSATVGDYGRYEYRLGVGGPLIPDILGVRAFYGRSLYGGTLPNSFPGITGDFSRFSGFERESYSGSVRFTPASNLTIDASYSRLNRSEEQRAYYSVDGTFIEDRLNCGPLNAFGRPTLLCGTLPVNPDVLRSGANPTRPLGLSSVQQPDIISNTDVYRASLEWKFTDAFTLSYLFGKTKGSAQENLSFPSNTFNPIGRATIAQQKEGGVLSFSSHEARINYDAGGPFKGEVGYYRSKTTDQFVFGLRFVLPNTPLVQLSDDPVSIVGLTVPFSSQKTNYRTDAVFGRASYDLLDGKANLTAEGRFTRTNVVLDDILARSREVTAGRDPDVLRPILRATFKDFSPRITAQYKVTPDNLLYASAARGVKAGGFNGYVAAATILLVSERSFEPEKNWTYEIGSKNELLDRKLTLNLAAFYVKWTNQQLRVVPANFPVGSISQGVVPPSIFAAIGNSTNYGVEIDGQFRPIPGLAFNFSFAYSNPTYSSGSVDPGYINVCDDVACPKNGNIGGNHIPGTPMVSATLGVDYRHELANDWALFGGADMIYRGKQYVETVNISQFAPVTLVNGRIGVERSGVKFFVVAKNLFNKRYLESSFVIPSLRQVVPSFGEGRTIAGTISFNF